MTRLRPAYPGEALLMALRDPLALVRRMAAVGDDVVRVRLGPRTLYLLCDPGLIREMLAYSGDALRKERALRLARLILGDGPVTSEGDLHREQRRRLRPVFERQRLAAYGEAVVEQAGSVYGRWRDGDLIDPYRQFRWLTLEATAVALFGRPLGDAASSVAGAVDVALRGFDRHRNPLAALLNRLPVPGTLRLRRARRTIRSAAEALVDDGAGPLAEVLREHPRRDLALDEAVTILLAGHETTAVALTWCCWLIAGDTEVEARLHREVDAVAGTSPLTAADQARLPYTRQVVAESMRLFPPVWAISREAVSAVGIGPYEFRRGAVLMVSPYALHRDPRHWPEPERFDPDRFADPHRLTPFTYVPFSGGVRGCMGEGLAWTESVLALAALARHWRLEREPGAPPGMRPGISLRPSLRLRARRRS